MFETEVLAGKFDGMYIQLAKSISAWIIEEKQRLDAEAEESLDGGDSDDGNLGGDVIDEDAETATDDTVDGADEE